MPTPTRTQSPTLTKKRILITFARSYLTLELARQLHAQGHDIYAVDSLPSPLSGFSNAVTKCFLAPSPRFDPNGYIATLQQIVASEKIDLLIPVYEEITYLSKVTHEFPVTCSVFCPDFNTYEQLQNKFLFQQKLEQLGFPTLKSFLVNSSNDLAALPGYCDYAIKPCHSRASQHVFRYSPSTAAPSLTNDPHNPWMAQEWATGEKFCSYSVCYQGTLNAHSVYPVTYAIGGNSCVIYESIQHPEILAWITKFVKATNYTGQIAFDFIEHNGQIYAIECNPRATSGLLLFKPLDGNASAFFGPLDHPIIPPVGRRKQVAMGMLLYGWRKSAKKDNNLYSFIKTFFTTKDVVFSFKDLKPFLLEPLIFVKLWLKSRALGISVPDFYTHDHDWNGESFNLETSTQK